MTEKLTSRHHCPIAAEYRRQNRVLLQDGVKNVKRICKGDCVRPDRGKYEECGYDAIADRVIG